MVESVLLAPALGINAKLQVIPEGESFGFTGIAAIPVQEAVITCFGFCEKQSRWRAGLCQRSRPEWTRWSGR